MADKFDLDTLNVSDNPHGDGREVFEPDPKTSWPDASSRVYVSTGRSGPEGVYQFGYDPESGKSWLRTLPSSDSRWTDWVVVDTAPRPHPVAVKSKAKAEDQEPEAPSKKK